jgi:calcium-dependent protein kinase
MKQVLSAICYCHKNKIVHRDLKPENLLYESDKKGSCLKVIDFGTSRQFDPNEKLNLKTGTVIY